MDNENIGFILILLFLLVLIIILILSIVNPRYPPSPPPQPQPQVYGGCGGTRFGCCPNSTLARHDSVGSNC